MLSYESCASCLQLALSGLAHLIRPHTSLVKVSMLSFQSISKTDFSGIPFYIFISILLGILGYGSVQSFWLAGQPAQAGLCLVLFVAHIGMYWLNFRFLPEPFWVWVYYPIQTVLILSLAWLPYPEANIGLSNLASATISMVGSSLGLWGNTRRSALAVLFYTGLMLAVLYFKLSPTVFWSVIPGILMNGGLVVLFMISLNQQLYEKQRAQELAERLESVNAQLAAAAIKNEILARQNERQRVARDLHDTLAQGVAGLVLQLEAVRSHLREGRNERASAIVEQSLLRARSTLADSRAAIDGLRAAPNLNLEAAAREQVARFEQSAGLACLTTIDIAENHGISPMVIEHTLHILGEALTNIARHARASQVSVRITARQGQLNLEVLDNGQGFDPALHPASGHYGLLGMKERARLSGGTLTIESSPARGTRVFLHIPSGAAL